MSNNTDNKTKPLGCKVLEHLLHNVFGEPASHAGTPMRDAFTAAGVNTAWDLPFMSRQDWQSLQWDDHDGHGRRLSVVQCKQLEALQSWYTEHHSTSNSEEDFVSGFLQLNRQALFLDCSQQQHEQRNTSQGIAVKKEPSMPRPLETISLLEEDDDLEKKPRAVESFASSKQPAAAAIKQEKPTHASKRTRNIISLLDDEFNVRSEVSSHRSKPNVDGVQFFPLPASFLKTIQVKAFLG